MRGFHSISVQKEVGGQYVLVNSDTQKSVFSGTQDECEAALENYYEGHCPEFEE